MCEPKSFELNQTKRVLIATKIQKGDRLNQTKRVLIATKIQKGDRMNDKNLEKCVQEGDAKKLGNSLYVCSNKEGCPQKLNFGLSILCKQGLILKSKGE